MNYISQSALVLLAGLSTVSAENEKVPVWKPEVGQRWQYQVSVTVQEGTELPKDIPNQKVEQLEGKVRATYPQTVTYRGLQPMQKSKQAEGDKKEEVEPVVGHAFTVYNSDQLVETQLMKISDQMVEAIGLHPAGGEPKLFDKAIPLLDHSWKGGEFFTYMLDFVQDGKKARIVRKCKVIGWENLETKAGKFRALHVQASGLNGKMEIKRSYWFAPGTGFVKEVKKYYVGERTILTQIRVLEKMGK